ncbi:Uncharacterized protein TCM_041907 [Theobroma cacao]|uniref:Uncharacterized protein n=1 Tax=Theobroma cacao TaxID=3641 RepID=A0A061GY95_THECC|nr:Uncharacterized protein TCM_041907 [Theobroma cacao]
MMPRVRLMWTWRPNRSVENFDHRPTVLAMGPPVIVVVLWLDRPFDCLYCGDVDGGVAIMKQAMTSGARWSGCGKFHRLILGSNIQFQLLISVSGRLSLSPAGATFSQITRLKSSSSFAMILLKGRIAC